MIVVDHFSKTFRSGLMRRRSVAAIDISFRVDAGEVFGFLGPNGAGKTTTIKALLNLIRPDKGKLEIVGHDVRSMAWRSSVGYMPEHPNFYDFLSGFEMVAWFGQLAGMTRHEAEREAKRQLARVGLAAAAGRRLRGYSKGMLQRAGLAQALIGSPKLLVLDEPMTGLDPIGRRDMRDLILMLQAEGRTVFYSTHILPDVEMTCSRVAIIHQGRTVRIGRLADFLTEAENVHVVFVPGAPTADAASSDAVRAFAATFSLKGALDGGLERDFEDIDEARRCVAESLRYGLALARFEPRRATLESMFLRALGPGGELGALGAPANMAVEGRPA